MLQVKKAESVFEKTEFNTEADYRIYPTTEYKCVGCGYKVAINLADLDKHRFSRFSNLSETDQIVFDHAALGFIPKRLQEIQRQPLPLNSWDRIVIFWQRLFLNIPEKQVKFLPMPKAGEILPDSFLDFYCPDCKVPVRIYYFSYLGGRHGEHGYGLQYVITV